MSTEKSKTSVVDAARPATRVFKFNTNVLPDPGIHMAAEEVADFYSLQHPDIASATIVGPTVTDVEKGIIEYEFKTKIGTKS